jgi:hypothetical protein
MWFDQQSGILFPWYEQNPTAYVTNPILRKLLSFSIDPDQFSLLIAALVLTIRTYSRVERSGEYYSVVYTYIPTQTIRIRNTSSLIVM